MEIINNVRGSQEIKPNRIEFNVDTVYVRTNIKRIDIDGCEENNNNEFHGWEYDEIQYTYPEYQNKLNNDFNI